jgi:uncharacterized protein YegP (UPF0339 family)
MSRTGSNPDRITVYKAFRDSDPMQLGVTTAEWRWTRRTTTNHRIVAASSEGYARKDGALRNIKRTQKAPYTMVIEEG